MSHTLAGTPFVMPSVRRSRLMLKVVASCASGARAQIRLQLGVRHPAYFLLAYVVSRATMPVVVVPLRGSLMRSGVRRPNVYTARLTCVQDTYPQCCWTS